MAVACAPPLVVPPLPGAAALPSPVYVRSVGSAAQSIPMPSPKFIVVGSPCAAAAGQQARCFPSTWSQVVLPSPKFVTGTAFAVTSPKPLTSPVFVRAASASGATLGVSVSSRRATAAPSLEQISEQGQLASPRPGAAEAGELRETRIGRGWRPPVLSEVDRDDAAAAAAPSASGGVVARPTPVARTSPRTALASPVVMLRSPMFVRGVRTVVVRSPTAARRASAPAPVSRCVVSLPLSAQTGKEALRSVTVLNPLSLRFSQARINPSFSDGSGFEAAIAACRERPLNPADLSAVEEEVLLEAPFPALEVIRFRARMRDPDGKTVKNPVSGDALLGESRWFTFDNRRLHCLQRAALERWPRQCFVLVKETTMAADDRKVLGKFKTTTDGTSITVASSKESVDWSWRAALGVRAEVRGARELIAAADDAGVMLRRANVPLDVAESAGCDDGSPAPPVPDLPPGFGNTTCEADGPGLERPPGLNQGPLGGDAAAAEGADAWNPPGLAFASGGRNSINPESFHRPATQAWNNYSYGWNGACGWYPQGNKAPTKRIVVKGKGHGKQAPHQGWTNGTWQAAAGSWQDKTQSSKGEKGNWYTQQH